jgi:Rrf2 family protein
MKYSTKVSDAVHILTFIYLNEQPTLTSTDIATSIHTNPSYVRQLLAGLKAAGLIISRRGQACPQLAKDIHEITLLDVYRAMEGNKPLIHLDTHTNPECHIGMNIQLALAEYYKKVQKAAEKQMAGITLADIAATYHKLAENWTEKASS